MVIIFRVPETEEEKKNEKCFWNKSVYNKYLHYAAKCWIDAFARAMCMELASLKYCYSRLGIQIHMNCLVCTRGRVVRENHREFSYNIPTYCIRAIPKTYSKYIKAIVVIWKWRLYVRTGNEDDDDDALKMRHYGRTINIRRKKRWGAHKEWRKNLDVKMRNKSTRTYISYTSWNGEIESSGSYISFNCHHSY